MTPTQTHLHNARSGFETINVSSELKEKALSNLERWLTDEEFVAARPQLEYLLESQDFNALFDAFFQQIPFGTGGRRGPVGYGTNRINPFTIATSIQGHCEFLKKHAAGGGDGPSVVIAYDVRCFQDLRRVYDRDRPNPLLGSTSRDFARIAAEVYAANGVHVWFPDPSAESYVSTPELSFAIRHLGAQGGLNISASHNHPDDNGAKIYNGFGSQEIPPLDEEMATIVEGVRSATRISWDEGVEKGLIRWIPSEVHGAYIDTNAGTTIDPQARSAKVIFTPLHGTGWSSVGATLQEAGFDVECYPGQASPDGTFPNVPFRSPNPEVPESLRGATDYARDKAADLVLAADPDADRLGMVVPDPTRGWTFLSGNQIGTILARYLFGSEKVTERRRKPFAVTTVVTTSIFRRMAEAHGIHAISDLGIGFKYIADVLNTLETEGEYRGFRASADDFVLGIEESHGYLVTPAMRDKDAAGAALLLAELASRLKNEGHSLLAYLDDAYRKFGYVSNHLVSTVMQGARGYINIRQIQESLRKSPPRQVGNLRVTRFDDRWNESGPLGKIVSSTDRASRDLLTFELEGGARIVLRPSGTESKNKIYVEVTREPLPEDAPPGALDREREEGDALSRRIARDFSLEMLARIGIDLPPYALEVSDLVSLEWKQDFANSFLPALLQKIDEGEEPGDVESWVDEHLSSYGADGRLLVRNAVRAYCDTEKPSPEALRRLAEIFEI